MNTSLKYKPQIQIKQGHIPLSVSLFSSLFLFSTLSILGCGPNGDGGVEVNDPVVPVDDAPGIRANKPIFNNGRQEVEVGQSEFISASGERGMNAGRADEDSVSAESAEQDSNDDRTVEEGDIYRVINGGLMANLNSYRGLQLIDISEPSAPRIISRLPLAGTPVEMYFMEGYAVVLMNNWWGYWGVRNDINVEQFNGGLAALIDIRDTEHPVLVSTQPVPGNITTSRLTRGMGGDALFVVANSWDDNGSTTILRSFSVETSDTVELTPASEVDLGGYVADIQATPSTLLIARQQGWWHNDNDWEGTYVSLIDISDPSGRVVEGGDVQVRGYVRRKTDMHIKNGVLRVVSSDWDMGSSVATWNIDDIQNPVPIDDALFGEGEDLYASLFMGDRAFFVTYRRVDPFHAFSIDSEGLIEERTEYIISGWNDFFRPTFNQSRLIGIGIDDQVEGQRRSSIAVSLYTTSLEESEPFIARAHGDLNGWSWSEARWDDRAFSVIENAVSVMSPDGYNETGLVLLPFSGYDRGTENERGGWRSGVQLFSFSDQSVTARGVMSHNSPVRRSFEPEEGVVGNLSELSLSLYDRGDLDEPSILGQIDLAPDVSRIYFFGEGPARYPVRFQGSNDAFYGWRYNNNQEMASAQLHVLPVGSDVDHAKPIVTIDVPGRADLLQDGDTLYVINDRYVLDEDSEEYQRSIDLSVIDFSDPTAPRERGSLDLSEIVEGYDTFYKYGYDYWGCWGMGYYWWGRPQLEVYPVESGLAVKTLEAQESSLGEFESCYLSTYDYESELSEYYTDDLAVCDMYDYRSEESSCQALNGYATCSRFEGGEFTCRGEIRRCVYTADEGFYQNDECEVLEAIDYVEIANRMSRRDECHSYERTRQWGSMRLSFVDMRDPDEPVLRAQLIAPEHENFEGLIIQEDELFYSYSVPVNVDGDDISYVRHFTRSINHQEMDEPQFNVAINLPGKLLLKRGDLVISRDSIWDAEGLTTTLNLTQLNQSATRARFLSRHLFSNRIIQKIIFDQDANGEERLFISHRYDYRSLSYWGREDTSELPLEENPYVNRVSIFELNDLELLGEGVSDQWSDLIAVRDGRGIFNVGGGVLMMDLRDPSDITPQAFFPLRGWQIRLTVESDKAYVAAGRFGVYTLDLESSNLLPPL